MHIHPITLQRLKYLTFGTVLVSVLTVLCVLYAFVPRLRMPLYAYGALILAVLAGLLVFNETVFRLIGRVQARQLALYRELLALHEAGLDIAEEVELDVLLRRVLERASSLVGADYGAVLPAINSVAPFRPIAVGLPQEMRGEVRAALEGCGSLKRVLEDRQRVRLDTLTNICGPLLAIPLVSRDRVLGAFLLGREPGTGRFTQDDEQTADRFATQAALAIQNAGLLRQNRELAISEERARIAREMHDSLAQVLGYVNTKAQAAQELLRSGQVDRTMQQMSQLGQAARDAYADVREGILGLRSSLQEDRGFLAALDQYIQRWQEQYGIPVHLYAAVSDEDIASLPATGELQLVRIIQEALSNVRKHSGATYAEVYIGRQDGHLTIVVADNGRGFDPDTTEHTGVPRFGLAGMQERAQAVGGSMQVQSSREEGTRVTVRLPLTQPATAAAGR